MVIALRYLTYDYALSPFPTQGAEKFLFPLEYHQAAGIEAHHNAAGALQCCFFPVTLLAVEFCSPPFFHKVGSTTCAIPATFWGLPQLFLVFVSQLCWDTDPTRASNRPESLHGEVTVQQLTFK